MIRSRAILAASSIALVVAWCSSAPMTPEDKARAEWVHQLKAEDPERARALAQACYEEVGFFSPQRAQTMAKCVQTKAGVA